jgi:hypothetical protein
LTRARLRALHLERIDEQERHSGFDVLEQLPQGRLADLAT